jgi:hypothetical protein
MRFSQRLGLTEVRKALQIEHIDELLENRIWNLLQYTLFSKMKNTSASGAQMICNLIWTEFLGQRLDETPKFKTSYSRDFEDRFKEIYFESEWYEKYDFIEFVADLDAKFLNVNFQKECNHVLKKELSGYRLIENKIVQVTEEEEIVAIENAIKDTSEFNSVNTHLKAAIGLLSNRENPDYRNSIKESISAIESISSIITGKSNTTLGAALKEIENKYQIHKALKSAFSSLYGYTSDSGGIRHSLLEDDIEVTFEDAKFMLVSCSAFISYLKEKIDR